MELTSKHKMEMRKSEKLLKKTKKKFSGTFFDMMSSKKEHGFGDEIGHLFPTIFLVGLSNSQKIRLFNQFSQ